MNKTLRKSLIMFLSLMFILSAFGTGAFAKGDQMSITQGQPEIAPLYGDFDLQSSQLTTVIVELQENSIVEAKHQGKSQSKANLSTERGNVVSALKNAASHATVNQEYDYVFSGFSVELPMNELPKLLALPGVKAVYPDVEYQVPSTKGELVPEEVYSPAMLDSAPYIGADDAWDNLGITGEGVTVAIIDTGVDYTHPDLAHAFGSYKGWDFVDNDDSPQETPVGDPRGEETTHGTHVAGTVAANGGIKGVAPEATLLAYRVLGPGGSGSTTDVVAGIERAVQDGADVMNLSLGNTLNNPDWATSIALDWAMAEGVVAVSSNGNSGPDNWTVGSPGTSRDAISVGATQLPYNTYHVDIHTSEDVSYPSSEVMGFANEDDLLALAENTYELVDVGMAFPEDFEGKDVEGKIALISRGDIPFVDKATNAYNAGAVGAILYNNVAGDIEFYIPGMAVPTVKLSDTDGQKILQELENGNNTVSFDIVFDRLIEETIAEFSSRGPVIGTWMIKPDVVAPGVDIVSTVPTHHPDAPHGYGSKQGTSMAAPHVAGAAALLLEAHPNWTPQQVKSALMNTAQQIHDANGNIYAHNTQGAGSIRVVDAIQADTLILPGSYSFGTFDKEQGAQVEKQKFTIQNLSNEAKTYNIDVSFAGDPAGIKVSTSNNLRVKANGTQDVQMNVQVKASQLSAGYYEGMISLHDGDESYEIPAILFVQEPDYPRITHFFIDEAEEGYELTVYLPTGAEEGGFWIYTVDTFSHVGDGPYYTNADPEYNYFSWDGKTLLGGEELAPGEYQIYAYAVQEGRSDYVYGDTFIVSDEEEVGAQEEATEEESVEESEESTEETTELE